MACMEVTREKGRYTAISLRGYVDIIDNSYDWTAGIGSAGGIGFIRLLLLLTSTFTLVVRESK